MRQTDWVVICFDIIAPSLASTRLSARTCDFMCPEADIAARRLPAASRLGSALSPLRVGGESPLDSVRLVSRVLGEVSECEWGHMSGVFPNCLFRSDGARGLAVAMALAMANRYACRKTTKQARTGS
jgi:hypothetical protein